MKIHAKSLVTREIRIKVTVRYPFTPTLSLFSCLVMSHSLWPCGLQHARLPCPSPPPRVCSNSCPLSQWCPPSISSSVVPFSSSLQSFPVSQLFTSGGQSIGASASASALPMNIQGWFPLGLTVLLSFFSKSSEVVGILLLAIGIVAAATVLLVWKVKQEWVT